MQNELRNNQFGHQGTRLPQCHRCGRRSARLCPAAFHTIAASARQRCSETFHRISPDFETPTSNPIYPPMMGAASRKKKAVVPPQSRRLIQRRYESNPNSPPTDIPMQAPANGFQTCPSDPDFEKRGDQRRDCATKGTRGSRQSKRADTRPQNTEQYHKSRSQPQQIPICTFHVLPSQTRISGRA